MRTVHGSDVRSIKGKSNRSMEQESDGKSKTTVEELLELNDRIVKPEPCEIEQYVESCEECGFCDENEK